MSPMTKASGCPEIERSASTITQRARQARGLNAGRPEDALRLDSLATDGDPERIDAGDRRPRAHLDPERPKIFGRAAGQLLRERWQDARSRLEQEDARAGGID